jgi:2-isopropylmalate synthase
MKNQMIKGWYSRWFTPEQFVEHKIKDAPGEISVIDSTLREGFEEGQACWSRMPTDEEIVEMAAAIDEAGVAAIELPPPANVTIKNYHEIEQVIKHAEKVLKVQVYLDDIEKTKKEIDLAVEVGKADRISNDNAGISNWFHGRTPQGYEKIKSFLTEMIAYTKEKYNISFHATTSDFTRTPLERLLDFAKAMGQAGADVIGFKDTFGAGNPSVIHEIVSQIRSQQPKLPIEIHCHDDMGLGVANSIAAVEAGATWVDVCLNGLGDRAGHTAFEQVVCILELSYGINTKIDLTKLRALSKLIQEKTGLYFHTKAFIGEGIFTEGRKRHLIHVITLKLRLMNKGSHLIEGVFQYLSTLLDSGKEYITEEDIEQAVAELEEKWGKGV